MNSHRILSLRVIGGFLDGLTLVFDTGLTCIIGARGTGKTTILELIRYALDQLPRKDLSPAERRRVENLIAGNLKGGRVELEVQTADGLRYIITRSEGEEPIVLDAQRNPTALSIKSMGFFRAEIFSQNEVENIAGQGRFQLDLIDSFNPAEVAHCTWEIDDVRDQIVALARQGEPLRQKLAALQEDIKQLPHIEEKLKALTGGAHASSTQINQAHEAKALRDRETRAVQAAGAALANYRTQLAALAGRLGPEVAGKFTQEMLTGANGAKIKAMVASLKACAHSVDETIQAALNMIATTRGGLDEQAQSLREAQDVQELEFRNLIESQKQFQVQSAERANCDRKRNELLESQRTAEDVKREIEKAENVRATLLGSLSELRDKRFGIRKQISDRLNAALNPTIKVTLRQDGNSDHYRMLLEEHLKGLNMRQGVVAQKIVELVPPSQLAQLVRDADVEGLIQQGNLNRDQAAKVINALSDPVKLAELETVPTHDAPTIALLDGSGYKDSTSLSTGQKCTTILPILLLENANPLLIDQPEDNLDNRFVSETVVASIQRARATRQLVFVTHNPNIPVLGDAGVVAVMESDGDHGRAELTGDVDECRDHIITLLEGGEEAFRQRGIRYKM